MKPSSGHTAIDELRGIMEYLLPYDASIAFSPTVTSATTCGFGIIVTTGDPGDDLTSTYIGQVVTDRGKNAIASLCVKGVKQGQSLFSSLNALLTCLKQFSYEVACAEIDHPQSSTERLVVRGDRDTGFYCPVPEDAADYDDSYWGYYGYLPFSCPTRFVYDDARNILTLLAE